MMESESTDGVLSGRIIEQSGLRERASIIERNDRSSSFAN